MKVRSAVRITLRLLFFGAWLAVGLIALAVYLGGTYSDQMVRGAPELADGDVKIRFQKMTSPLPESAPPSKAAVESAADQAEGVPRLIGTADIDTGGGPGDALPAAGLLEEGQLDEEDVWGGVAGDTIGESFGEGQGLGLRGTGRGGGGISYGGTGIGMIGSGSAPQASSPNNSSDEDLSDVDRRLADLPLGNIAFNTPESIPLGESARIELLVSMKEAEEELRRAVRAAGPVESARVKISDQMEARLTGLGFRIEAITPERQAVTRGERTQWQWQIEPNKSATLELHLTLSALIEVNGAPSTRAIRTFERTIQVEVPLVHRLADVVSGNLELLTTVVLIPVAGGIWRLSRKKKQAAKPSADDAPSTKRAA